MRSTRTAFALLLVFSTACASAVRGGNGSEAVFLEVRNDLVPPRAVTIRIMSSSGTRRLVGAVSPGQTRVFRIREPNFVGTYRLVAELDGGGQVISPPASFSPDESIVWTLRSNLLRFTMENGSAAVLSVLAANPSGMIGSGTERPNR